MAMQSEWTGGKEDAAAFCTEQYNRVLTRLKEIDAGVGSVFDPLPAGSSLTVVVLTLGLLLWDRFAVVARATTMQVRNLDFVAAAWCAGCSRFHILAREVLPNIASHLVVVATLEVALAILLEAALSFLGLGVPPPLPSWGLMIAEAKDYMFFSPWVIVIPGVALFLLVLGINLLGDGLRDQFGASADR